MSGARGSRSARIPRTPQQIEAEHGFRMEVLDNLIAAIDHHLNVTDWDEYRPDDRKDWADSHTARLKQSLRDERRRIIQRQKAAERQFKRVMSANRAKG